MLLKILSAVLRNVFYFCLKYFSFFSERMYNVFKTNIPNKPNLYTARKKYSKLQE